MRLSTIVGMFVSLVNLALLFGQGGPGGVVNIKSELSICGKTDENDTTEHFRYRMGQRLRIKATGSIAERIKEEWTKTQTLTLYLDAEPIASLKTPPQQEGAGDDLRLIFSLDRNAEDEANRQAWDRLLRKKPGYLMKVQPTLAIGKDLPLMVSSNPDLELYIAPGWAISTTLILGLVVLLVSYTYIVMRTKMLHDSGKNYFSLGKSQMAFWGLLVVLSLTGIWILTGTMERIHPQVLILLGVSSATGLSAVVIGNSKKTASKNELAKKQSQLATLRQQEMELQQQQINAPSAFSAESQHSLDGIKSQIDSIQTEIIDLSSQLQNGESKGFWRDICDDGDGPSFHRLQVVIWTLVLGGVFVNDVARIISMPEFSETLLTLMGISNATYLGFKIPEKS